MKTPVALRLLATLVASVLAMPARAQLSVQWLTQYGTSTSDYGQAIAVDALGRSWVSGYTSGSLGGSSAGNLDVFLSRLSASGSVDFTVQRGGSDSDVFNAVAVTGTGTVFAGGYTLSPTFDGQGSLGGADSIAIRYTPGGAWQGTARTGGNQYDVTYAMAGNATHVLAAGTTSSSFAGQTNAGFSDAFLTKLDPTGATVWIRFAGTGGDDYGRGTAFDSAGNGYLTGETSRSFAGFTNAGSSDIFVARYDPVGNQTLLKQFGTSGYDRPYDVEVDASGNIYLTGGTSGNLGGQTNHGSSDAFLTKLDSAGNVLWTRLLGGTDNEESYGLALDAAGHVWIGGYSYSSFGGHTVSGFEDAFVAEYDSAGSLLGTLFLTSTANEVVNGLAIGPDGAAYVTGWTSGALGAPNSITPDVFVAKITGVPEPSAALLLATAGTGLLLRRRRA